MQDGSKLALFHCWVETTRKLDIASDVLNALRPDFRRMTGNSEYRLSESLLEGYERNDKDNEEEENILKINNIMFDSYISNPVDFWSTCLDDT